MLIFGGNYVYYVYIKLINYIIYIYLETYYHERHRYRHQYTAFKRAHVKHLQAVMQTCEAFLLIDMQSLATKKVQQTATPTISVLCKKRLPSLEAESDGEAILLDISSN